MAPDNILDNAPFAASDAAAMFEFAPISLWAEDFSALKRKFDEWRRAGITDLRAWLQADQSRILTCWKCVRVLHVNRRSFDLFTQDDLADLSAATLNIFHPDILPGLVDEFVQLWTNGQHFSVKSVNFSLGGGRRIDIRLHGRILPGHESDWSRVVVAIEDITAETESDRRTAESEAFARALFDQSPVSLWVYDLSGVKILLDGLRASGVQDFRAHIAANPELVQLYIKAMRPLDVNQHTLKLYGAPDKATLLARRNEIFLPETYPHLAQTLIGIWDGGLPADHETVNYNLNGDRLHLVLHYALMPGHEEDASLVLVALTDITARKKAEASLAWLSLHDPPTGLGNRAFHKAEMTRLATAGPFPISVVIADLDGLKAVNDECGHAAGDQLLGRAGAILRAAAPHGIASRIGGDEFAILLPGTDEAEAQRIHGKIVALVGQDNRRHPDHALSISLGTATRHTPGPLEPTVRQADLRMYDAKRAYYIAHPSRSRRRAPPPPPNAINPLAPPRPLSTDH
jgi:diguanylate cyclase (GGDEF)-like protein